MKIPLVDLNVQHTALLDEISAALQAVIRDSAFILGKYAEEFLRNFASYCNAKSIVLGLVTGLMRWF